MRRREVMVALMGREPDISFSLPYLPPQQPNQSYQGTNIHVVRAQRRKIKERCIEDVTAMLLQAGWDRNSPPFKKAEIMVTFVLPTHGVRDHDNLVAGMKPIYDAMHPDKKEERLDGLIADDNVWVISVPMYDVEYRKGVSETVIEVWDTTQQERLIWS